MSYLILYALLAVWVFFDGLSRRMGTTAGLWTAGTVFLGPIILPMYLAYRPLREGELREGGKAWNILKNFAILWTVCMAVISIAGMIGAAKGTENLTSDAERAGAGIGMAVGLGLLGALWFFPTVGAAVLGFLMKKNSAIENGPTGPLVNRPPFSNPLTGWPGLVAAAMIGLLLNAALNGFR